MTFNELWTAIEKTGILPKPAIEHIPLLLSKETKEKILDRDPEEIARALNEVIQGVNNGSTEKLDILLNQKLK